MKANTLITAWLVLVVSGTCQACNSESVEDLLDDWPRCIYKSDCLKKNFVIYKGMCTPKCPDDAHFIEISTGTCFQECPINSVQNGTNCLSPTLCTDRNQKVFNRSCVSQCPNETDIVLAGVCNGTCPMGSILNGSTCISIDDCVLTSKIFNGECMDECPDQTYLTIKKNKTCVSTCPANTVALKRSCITDDECINVHGLVIHGSSCIENCPLYTYLHDGFCKTDCPAKTYIDGAVCEIDWLCINKGRYVYNSSCTEECPQEAPNNEHGYCVYECPYGTVLEEKECIYGHECVQLNKFIHDGTCVLSCPDTHPYFYHYKCHSQCPNEYTIISYLNACITETKCTYMKKVVHNGRCLDSCPDTDPIPKGSGCVSTCPADNLLYNYRCINERECTAAMQYFKFEGRCVKACPTEAPLLRLKTKECFSIARCPRDTVLNGTLCVSKTVCTSNNKLIYNNTCVDVCPVESRYNASWVCLEKCPDKTFPENQICRPKSVCINSGRHIHEGKCISRCPDTKQYVHDGDCVSQCPNGTRRLGVFCRTEACISSEPLFDGKECISVSSCGKIQFEGGCIDYCPHEYFRYQDGCRELPNILLPVSVVLALIVLCIGTLVTVLYEPEVSSKRREHLDQNENPIYDTLVLTRL